MFKIKYKTIKIGKHNIDFSNPAINKQLTDLNRGLKNTLNDGIKIFWLDEAVFSFNTFAKRAWYLNRKKLLIPEKAYQIKTQALILAISLENGIEHYKIHPRSICTE